MHFTKYARIAAILLIVVLSGIWLYTYLNKAEEKVLVASGAIVETTLPDGSSITLQRGSTLTYPSQFKENKRVVALKGEAYFDIIHDESHPFLITSDNICIEVLGTSFYVNTCNAVSNLEVVLTSGKVAVYYAEAPENKTILLPGERIEMPTNGHLFQKTLNTDVNYLAWKTKKLVFTDQPLQLIVKQLNKVYDSQISISRPDIAGLRMTATFDNQELQSVLKVIEVTLDVDINKKGDTFVISESR